MLENEQINDFFQNIIFKSKITHTVSNGFDKYIVYNDNGSLFSIGFNKTIKKYGFGRTELMLKEYKKHNLSPEKMPDFPVVYNDVIRIYETHQTMSSEFKSIFDLLNRFTGKNSEKR